MLEEKLTKLGFSLPEARVYSSLIRYPGLLAGVIAKKANMSRSSVYSVLDSLIKKGLVGVSYQGRVKYFVAEGLEKIEELLLEEEKRLIQKKHSWSELIAELKQIKDSQVDRPEVTFYEGHEAVKTLFKTTAKQNRHLYQLVDEEILKTPESRIFIRERVKNKTFNDILMPDSKIARQTVKEDQNSCRETHLINQEYKAPAIITAGDEFVSIYTWEEGQPIGIKIRNKKIVESMETLFKLAIKGAERTH